MGKTIYTVDVGSGIVVVRDVPASICSQCGEEWISPPTARELEKITEDARRRREQFAVLAMS